MYASVCVWPNWREAMQCDFIANTQFTKVVIYYFFFRRMRFRRQNFSSNERRKKNWNFIFNVIEMVNKTENFSLGHFCSFCLFCSVDSPKNSGNKKKRRMLHVVMFLESHTSLNAKICFRMNSRQTNPRVNSASATVCPKFLFQFFSSSELSNTFWFTKRGFHCVSHTHTHAVCSKTIAHCTT